MAYKEIILKDLIKKNYLGYWGIPNTYHNNGTLVMFNTKERAIKYYQKKK